MARINEMDVPVNREIYVLIAGLKVLDNGHKWWDVRMEPVA